jgi:hypothetical protein
VVSELLDDLRSALSAASQTARGQKAVKGHDEDFDLEVSGYGTFHVAISRGSLEISRGASPRQEALHYTLVQVDEATLRGILGGEISPVAAMEEGKLFLRTRLYGGGLITILLRSCFDLARERRLSTPSRAAN